MRARSQAQLVYYRERCGVSIKHNISFSSEHSTAMGFSVALLLRVTNGAVYFFSHTVSSYFWIVRDSRMPSRDYWEATRSKHLLFRSRPSGKPRQLSKS